MQQIQRLVTIMARLRGENGCPWDLEQTHLTLKKYLIEEAYECLDAIDSGNDDMLADELGDVLLQVVFHCQIASEEKRFDLERVAETISDKLVRRHPHVFGEQQLDTAGEVLAQWEDIKKSEKASEERHSVLDGVPSGLPALMKAEKLQKKAAKAGFDWSDTSQVLDKLKEEISELEDALENDTNIAMEYGDVLFSLVNLARFLKLDPEDALRQTNGKFDARFRYIESRLAEKGSSPESSSLEEMDQLWDEAKKQGL